MGTRGGSPPPPPRPPVNSSDAGDELPWWALLDDSSGAAAVPPPGAAEVSIAFAEDGGAFVQQVQAWLSSAPALAAPVGGGAAPGAVLASVLADLVARNGVVPPAALATAAAATGLGAAAFASLFSLWTSPVYGPYLLEAWAQAESAIWPGAAGAG
jgi:hypothetical protein